MMLKRLTLLPCALLTGCTPVLGRRSPTTDILGSYFPAWMVSVFAGLAITLLLRLLLMGWRLDQHVGPRALVYLSVWLCFTLLTWLIFYRN